MPLEIWQIQGSSSVSPYNNQIVTTLDNIVVATGPNRFFIQTPPGRSDGDPATSDGMVVWTGSNPGVSIGAIVSLTGKVVEIESTTAFSSSGLELTISNGDGPLPPPVALTASFPGGQPGGVPDLERVEGMRVIFEATVCGPSGNNELAALYTAPDRPFREPGITWPGQAGLPVWDGNPELFWFDPNGLSAPNNRFLNAGMTVSATAVIQQDNSRYLALPINYTASGPPLLRGVRSRNGGEITIGSINVELLDNDGFLYLKKLKKLARHIVELMDTPDILAIQEVFSLNELEDLINYIQLENPQAGYSPYLIPGFGEINVAYLLRPSIQHASVTQLGRLEFFSQGGQLHDRPPLLLEATVASQPPTPIRVLNLHLRSLIGIEGSNASFVRNKRYEQSLSVAQMVQQRQTEDLVIVGDFNAFPFTDGYVDVVNQISGEPSLGAQLPVQGIVSPPLIDHSESLPAAERYSYVFNGNAQLLDHCLSTELSGFTVTGFEFVRANADNAVAYEDNEFLLPRSSDHDSFVLFLAPNNPLVATREPAGPRFPLRFPNPFRLEIDELQVLNTLAAAADLRLFDARGRLVWRQSLPNGSAAYRLPSHLPQGMYTLQVVGNALNQSEKIILIGGE